MGRGQDTPCLPNNGQGTSQDVAIVIDADEMVLPDALPQPAQQSPGSSTSQAQRSTTTIDLTADDDEPSSKVPSPPKQPDKGKQPDKAFEIRGDMQRKELEPGMITCSEATSTCEKGEQPEPRIITCNAAISAWQLLAAYGS